MHSSAPQVLRYSPGHFTAARIFLYYLLYRRTYGAEGYSFIVEPTVQKGTPECVRGRGFERSNVGM